MELYHYGIDGMKWGVRRFQNEDGSLTELGRQRYGVARRTSQERNIFGRPTRRAKAAMKEAYEIEREIIGDPEVSSAVHRAQRAIENGTPVEQASREFVNSIRNYSIRVMDSVESDEDARRIANLITANAADVLFEVLPYANERTGEMFDDKTNDHNRRTIYNDYRRLDEELASRRR